MHSSNACTPPNLQPLQHLLHWLVKYQKRDPLQQSWNACLQTISLPTFIIQSLVSRPSGHVILQTCQIQKPPILLRNCIASLGVVIFCNYQHIIFTTKDGTLINTCKFPLSLGTYATIPKAPCGKAIDRLPAKYLDIDHIDIAFGNCVSVIGFKFALIFVYCATRYNWTFGFKSLQNTMTYNWPSLLFTMKPAP